MLLSKEGNNLGVTFLKEMEMEESEGKLLSKARRETGGTFSKGEGGGRE